MPDPRDDDRTGPAPDQQDGPEATIEATIEALSMKNSFGTAVGAAMLGFEQALRREPPPEVLAAEHMPEREHVADDRDDVVIEFPDPIERQGRPAR
jgi:hypothetical protein